MKQEECLPAEESPFSDDILEGSDEDIEQFVKSSTTLDYGASAASDGKQLAYEYFFFPTLDTTVDKTA